MTIRLYLDEDSSDTQLVKALRMRGLDVASAAECGMLGRTDVEQVEWCVAHGRVLYSANRRDFYRIHAQLMREGKNHPGIILGLQQHYSVGERMRRLLRLVASLSAEDMVNRVEFLSRW
ncbi:MAG: DUF5615 family PIN-like protein [Verrucomicrobiae bacterium]|nr:DUF5615 family PIN-like protein [Verrucomicrobiae bacterium]MDW8308254.1 DUF5615 family PIN-like protein [Verrucomicrobiales bacterium]